VTFTHLGSDIFTHELRFCFQPLIAGPSACLSSPMALPFSSHHVEERVLPHILNRHLCGTKNGGPLPAILNFALPHARALRPWRAFPCAYRRNRRLRSQLLSFVRPKLDVRASCAHWFLLQSAISSLIFMIGLMHCRLSAVPLISER